MQSYQENDVIYGRDDEIKALYTRIVYNTQTVVYGKSGIGKSSIINAGIIPRAKHDDMLPVSIRLAHTTKKEQTATAPYVEQIFQRIQEETEKIGGELEEIVPHTVSHPESLWEMLHRYRIWEGKGEQRKRIIPLLLFDQFEEIFTLEIDHKRVESFFSELADLLNDVKPTYLTPTEDDNATTVHSPQRDEDVKTRNVFTKIANRKRNASPEYLDKSEFHLVITLREDFLSYLERYTVYIPVMKQNRFPLLPLNEEQAAKIITEPVLNLIQPAVAEIIIQRVTGRKDFRLDGIPEIEVDAALLSLYMEQLYERKDEADTEITSELVVQSDDIIKKFYEDSITGIPDETIEYLEDELITNANRRNNVARIDLLSGGVSEEDLDKLIDKKVLRQFSYGGDLRIEFIHDILCPIVNDRIEHREQIAKEREEQKKREEEEARREKERLIQEEKMRKVTRRLRLRQYILYGVIGLLIMGAGLLAWWMNQTKEQAIEEALESPIHTVKIELTVDSVLSTYTWTTKVSVYTGNDSLVDTRTISQGGGNYPIYLHDSIFHRCDSLRVVVEQDSLELCQRGEQTFRIEQGKKKHTLCMAINRNEDKTFPLQGTVFYLPPKKGGKTQKDTLFVDQAVVAYGNHVTITDQYGKFKIPLNLVENNEKKLGCDYLAIYKKGFNYVQYEVSAAEKYQLIPEENMPIDSILEKKREAVDALYKRMDPDQPLTAEEKEWMTTLAVLGNTEEDKKQLFTHEFYAIKNEEGKVVLKTMQFLSRKKGDSGDRPVYGWVYNGYNSYSDLFDGYATCIDEQNKIWRMRITYHEQQNKRVTEYLLVVKNPFGNKPNVQEVWRHVCADGKWRWECLKKE